MFKPKIRWIQQNHKTDFCLKDICQTPEVKHEFLKLQGQLGTALRTNKEQGRD